MVGIAPPEVSLDIRENGPANQRVIHVGRLLDRDAGQTQVGLRRAEQVIQLVVIGIGANPHDLFQIGQQRAGSSARDRRLTRRLKRRLHAAHSSAPSPLVSSPWPSSAKPSSPVAPACWALSPSAAAVLPFSPFGFFGSSNS